VRDGSDPLNALICAIAKVETLARKRKEKKKQKEREKEESQSDPLARETAESSSGIFAPFLVGSFCRDLASDAAAKTRL